MSLSLASTWLVGIINGFHKEKNEKGLPKSITYGTMGITSSLGILKSFAHLGSKPTLGALSTLVVIPIFVGSTFCLGDMIGRSVTYTKKVME